MNGTFITFEGLDGSGKTTQLDLLAQELQASSFTVLATREPGGTFLGKQIRGLILDETTAPAPLAELLLFAADRAQHVETVIRPALANNKIVVSDRYADATIAYQGAGRGFDKSIIAQIVRLATGDLQPDITLFFDLPIAESLARIAHRTNKGAAENRLDKEKHDFYERVRSAYLEIARAEPNRFRIINAAPSIEEVHCEVLETVISLLK